MYIVVATVLVLLLPVAGDAVVEFSAAQCCR